MTIISTTELLRNPKVALDALETNQDPVLLVANGQPFALLTRVAPDQAASLAMAVLPEYVKSRHQAEHARRQGRTITGPQLLARLQGNPATPQ